MTSLGIDRLGWDTVQRMWDPEAGGAFARIQQRARKETGTQFWWRPGREFQLATRWQCSARSRA